MKPKKIKLARKKKKKDDASRIEIIRPELNLEKWPSIWQPAKSRNNPKARGIERELTLPDGSKISAKIKISPNIEYGSLTTEDQKIYYALIHLWERSGQPSEILFSARQLANTLGKTWGSESREAIKQSLYRLRFTAFVWTNAYYDSASKETIRELDTFTILSKLHISERESVSHPSTKQQCQARFYDLIDANLRNGHTKPLLPEVVFRFKSGIAQLLYSYLDLVMANRNHFERRTEELFEDLGLEGEAYKQPSNRKQVLKAALPELQETPIPSGVLTVKLDVTRDGRDYKLIANKKRLQGALPTVSENPAVTLEIENKDAPPRQDVKDIDSTPSAPEMADPAELVHYFHICFGIRRAKPTAKEMGHASNLISNHHLTLEQGKYVVDFSFKAARKTGFSIQNFGGIVQYVEPALSEFQTPNSKPQDQYQLETPNSQTSFNFAADLDTIDRRGKELLDGLPEAERRDLMATELQSLRESDKWNVYAKWEQSVLTEHLEMLAGRRLVLGEA